MPLSELQPIPGDPLAVAAAARTFDSIAAEIASTSAKLRALATANSHWTGNAATQAKTRTITLPPKLDKAQRSYATAGGALRNYANALDDAQRRSQAAVRSADVAHADLSAARAAQQSAAADDASRASAAAAAGLPTPQPTAPRYDTEISDAEARLANAVRANDEAHDDLRRAARTAAVQLHEASRAGIKNQPWWRHVINSAARFASSSWTTSLRVVARVATAISALAGLAALAVSVVGLVFPPLEGAAAVLETISLVSGVVATCADAAIAASGNGSWTSVGADAIALAPWAGSKLVNKTVRLLKNPTRVAASTRSFNEPGNVRAAYPVFVGSGVRTRSINYRPRSSDPNWGLRGVHLDKHLFGTGASSLAVLDPAGNPDRWISLIQALATMPATSSPEPGIDDIVCTFERSDRAGSFRLGIRISRCVDGTYDLVTLLTRQ